METALVKLTLVEIALVRDLPVHGMMKDLLGQSTDFKGHLKQDKCQFLNCLCFREKYSKKNLVSTYVIIVN